MNEKTADAMFVLPKAELEIRRRCVLMACEMLAEETLARKIMAARKGLKR